jgi:hypothetical protein
MGKELKMQPSLLHVPITKDIVYTPVELAQDMVQWFNPRGICLDPCAGDDVFYNLLPAGSDWCEIERGRDFYAWTKRVDWIIGNPPYSNLLAWIRHSFTVADDIVYLMPLHRVFASAQFLSDLFAWGCVAQIRLYGTGTDWGFPFGHALAAVNYRRMYHDNTTWSSYK